MHKLSLRVMTEADIDAVVPLFIEHNNKYEDCQYTYEKAYKRIHQVWNREDSLCMVLTGEEQILGFVTGFFEQYDDLTVYDLWEIMVSHHRQGQGLGTKFMEMIEDEVKQRGASMIQLISVNDEMHHHFYGKLGYGNCSNLVLKSKFLK